MDEIILRKGDRVTAGSWIEWSKTSPEFHGSTGEWLGESEQDSGASWGSWDGGFCEGDEPELWMALPSAVEAASPVAVPGAYRDDSRVPDDYQNAAADYRAGWNDCRAAMLAAAPTSPKAKVMGRHCTKPLTSCAPCWEVTYELRTAAWPCPREKNSMKNDQPKPALGMPFRALMASLRKGVTREQLRAVERQR